MKHLSLRGAETERSGKQLNRRLKMENSNGYFMLEDVQKDLLVKGENTYTYGNRLGQWVHLTPNHKEWTFKVNYSKNINIKNITNINRLE